MLEPNPSWLVLIALVAVAGISGGLLAGLLGVGGGIVIVPLLELAFTGAGLDPEVTMHLAVATSMATIVPTSISSSRAHARRDSVDHRVVASWAPWIVGGALLGALVAARLDGRVLAFVFAALALGVAARMLLQRPAAPVPNAMPSASGGSAIPAAIGFLSALLGIGGGTLSVPALTWRGLPIHRAVGTAARIGLWISLPATIGFLLARPPAGTAPPLAIGYVHIPAFVLVSMLTWICAPWGARIAHRASRRLLTAAFSVFLLAVAVRMLLRAYGG
ncbi:MAG TPA: sulfite exporter TauE/SafE family protein [Steroidobacteraceae bacterium]|nr:sulfite exporter TauE/SafE family protein [Steroidobacteraceae bacterium]